MNGQQASEPACETQSLRFGALPPLDHLIPATAASSRDSSRHRVGREQEDELEQRGRKKRRSSAFSTDQPYYDSSSFVSTSATPETSAAGGGALPRGQQHQHQSTSKGPRKKVKVGPRAQIACLTCRRRKVRCSGDWPICAFCSKKSFECVYEGHPAENGGGSQPATSPHRARQLDLSAFTGPPEPILPPIDIQLQALEVFFEHSYSTFYFLHKPTLAESIKATTVSKPLMCCILASASRFYKPLRDIHPESPKAAGEHYAALAAQVLSAAATEEEVSLLRCHCFLILGMYECMDASENQGWYKIGLAIRMAQVLRLGLLDESSPSMSAIEVEMRRRTFWSCFLIERFLADGKDRPCTLVPPPNTSLLLPGSDADFTAGRTSRHAVFDPDPPPYIGPARRRDSGLPDADLYGHVLRAAEIWHKVSTFIGLGGRNYDRRPAWSPESTFAQLDLEIKRFRGRLPLDFLLHDRNMAAHAMIGHCRLFALLHLLISLADLILHRDHLPFLPPFSFDIDNGPIDGEPVYSDIPPPPGWYRSSVSQAYAAGESITLLCERMSDLGSPQTHPFAGYALLAASTVQVHHKFWPKTFFAAANPRELVHPTKQLLGSFKDLYTIAASWVEGFERLYMLYANSSMGFSTDTSTRSVRASVIKMLRSTKDDDEHSPARSTAENSAPSVKRQTDSESGTVENATDGLLPALEASSAMPLPIGEVDEVDMASLGFDWTSNNLAQWSDLSLLGEGWQW